MTRDELARRVSERALLHGDFVLRSGKRSSVYLDKYRFETDPALLGPIGAALAELARASAPAPDRLAGPELGAVPLAAAAALASGIPFLIVRKATKDYATEGLIEGVFEAGRARARDRGRRHHRRRADRGRSRRCARPGWSSSARSACSIARKAGARRSRRSACGSSRSSAGPISACPSPESRSDSAGLSSGIRCKRRNPAARTAFAGRSSVSVRTGGARSLPDGRETAWPCGFVSGASASVLAVPNRGGIPRDQG